MANKHRKRKSEDSESSSDCDNEDVEHDLKKLIETLPKERVVALLKGAAMRHSDVRAKVRETVDKDPIYRKLFVRGFGWETTDEALHKVFSKYGEIEEAAVVRNRKQQGRRYGFVTFVHLDSALRALREPSKTIEGRTAICVLSNKNSDASKQNNEEVITHPKIYIPNIPEDMTFEKLHTFFSQYGEIAVGPLGFDKSGKSLGYTLIVYESVEGAKKALEEPVKTLDGVKLRCRLAESAPKTKESSEGKEVVANAQPANASPAVPSLGAGVLSGYGPPLDASALQSGLALNRGLAGSYSSLAGLGLGGLLNPSLYALRSSVEPSLVTSLYPVSSDSTAQGLASSLGHGLFQPGGPAGLASLGAQSPGLASYSGHLAAYARLAAASSYDSGLMGTSQAGIISGPSLASSLPGSDVSPYSTASIETASFERARTTGTYSSLGFH